MPERPPTHKWTLPEPRDVLEVRTAGGAITYVRRHGDPNGPRLVLSHGNGLAADTYFPFWSLLTAQFDLFVYDLRNHGWNPVGNRRTHHMPSLIDDCEAVREAINQNFGRKPLVGIFHSVSAVAALLLEQRWESAPRENQFSALVLFDLPLHAPRVPYDKLYRLSDLGSAVMRNRQPWFESHEEFVRRHRSSRVFRRLLPGVAELLAETTLRPATGRSGYELRCPREYEAQIVAFEYGWTLQVELGKIPCPVKAIGADPTEPFSFLPGVDLSTLIGVDYDFVPETTHFLQLERPEECARLTVEFLQQIGHSP